MKEKKLDLRPSSEIVEAYGDFVARHSGRVLEALEVATAIHIGDIRKTTGEPYINHCIAVTNILEQWGSDEDEVIAGLLHDTVEDHPDLINLETIEERFGGRVAFLVSGVTLLRSKEGEKNEFETLRKVTKGTLIDVGVAKIKLADRKHNMLTMEGMKPETQKRKAKETLMFYAPLAESLGMWQVKNELEDISFIYYDPARFDFIKKMVDSDPRLKPEFISEVEEHIAVTLEEHGIKAIVRHEVGGYWEISEKQKRLGIRGSVGSNDISEITDIISFRVLLDDDNAKDCYTAMGLMRVMLSSGLVKERSDDYIRQEAVNGYSALHDTYRFGEGNIEIAYTTRKRENFNNWGVVSMSKDEVVKNPDAYLRKLVFTPKEELVFLQPSANGIDVAYKLNPLLGMKAVAIKIDGKLSSLNMVVPSNSLVEIIVDPNKNSPDVEWLESCSVATRRKIEKQLMVSERDLVVESGRRILTEEVLVERGILDLGDLGTATVKRLLTELSCWYGVNDLYYKVAMGTDLQVIRRKLDELGIGIGVFTTLQVTGENRLGISKDIASILARHKADTRNVVETVDENDRFLVRILMKVDYNGKKKIEEEVGKKYGEWVVV